MIRKSVYLHPGATCAYEEVPHKRYGSLRYDVDDLHRPPLETLKLILNRAPKDRSLRSIQFLLSFTSNIKFFQALVRDQSEEAQYQCCQHMTYEYHARNEYLFHKGDIGTKFYIILEGACAVLVPFVKDDTEELHEVKVYVGGDSFGELALIKNQPRAATILCKEDTHFAVLERDDFTRIIGKVKELLLNRKVEFLMSFPVFSKWTKGSMQKVSYYFQERTYRRRQVVFRAGDEPAELFFIKSGEFQVLQSLNRTTCEMAILSKDQLFGEEDVLENQPRSYTCVCHSAVAEVLTISKEDFFKRVNNEDSLNHLKGMYRMKMDFHKKRRETITHVQNAHQSPLLVHKPRSQRESPVVSSASASKAAVELRKYVIWRNPLYPDAQPSPRAGAVTAMETLGGKSGVEGTTQDPTPTGTLSRHQTTWDQIIMQKITERENPKASPPRNQRKVVNIHTNEVRKKQLRSLTLRELSDLTGPRTTRKPEVCDSPFTPRFQRNLFMVKSLSDLKS